MREIGAVLAKDLLLEWRGRARLLATVLFGVVALALFSFAAGADPAVLDRGAPGFLVLALLLSSTLALGESFRVEQEDSAMEGLLLLPIDPHALFYGKALGNTLFLSLLGPVLAVAAVVFYAVDAGAMALVKLVLLWVLAAAGLSAPGTLYAAMTSRARSQDVLLPLVHYPLVIPVLLASVKAIDLILNGDPMGQLGSWTALLAGFALAYWSLGGVLFPLAVEE
ncbi:MAG TPA: heme exporter protein CcmB [Thermoanaerobaculia bacterium]|nr:heme exporter protein CcmB [Thermoanaerobaculia bacterium]